LRHFRSCFFYFSFQVPESAEPTKVIVGVAVPTLADLPLYFGVDKGFYKTQNLEVVQVFFRSGPTVAQALVAGSIQFSTGFGSGTRAAMLGAPIKGIMGFQNKSPMVLYGRPESGIRSGFDLKRKRIAVTGVGGTTDYAVRTIVKHYNLDPNKDVSVVPVGSDSVFPVLEQGSVDAAVLWPPATAMAEKLGMVKIQALGDLLELAATGIVSSDAPIEKNSQLVKRFLRASVASIRFIQEPRHNEQVISYIVQKLLGRDLAQRSFSLFLGTMSPDGTISRQAMENAVQFASERVSTSEPPQEMMKRMYAFHPLEEVLKHK
jgi:ABC-type nitrate/sulfonate/bicarbonate transport system substrate-binding protein